VTYKVALLGQIVVFQPDYAKIELQIISYDFISVTSWQFSHRKTPPK